MDIYYILAGFGVGLAVGLTGIGGGALMTPILVLGFKIPLAVAVGTDLVYAAITKITGVWVYARRSAVRWDIVLALLGGSLPGTLLTLAFLDYLALTGDVERLIKGALGVALVLSALALLFKEQVRQIGRGERFPQLRSYLRRWRTLITIVVGAILGLLVTLTSVGAGALGTAALIILYPGLAVPALVGTELAHALVLAAVAGAGHWNMGSVDYGLLLALLAGSLPGVYLGSRMGFRLPERIVRPVISSVLLFLANRLILQVGA